MTITEEVRATNGHARGRGIPGEFVSKLPSLTLSSGHTVYLRRQPADVMPKAQAAAQRDLEAEKPTIPTQRLETAPGEFHEIEHDKHPDYVAALAEWNGKVGQKTSEKLFTIMLRLALVFEVDEQELAALRSVYADQGIDLPEDDRTAYLNHVIAPLTEDQARLFEEVFGRALPTEAQVALHRAMFPGDVEGHADRPADGAARAG